MSGDCQILCAEYAQQSRMARYMLTQLPEYTCLVMETLERKQRLYHYRVGRTEDQNEASSFSVPDEIEASDEKCEQNQSASRLETSELLDRTEGGETCGSDVSEKS